MGLRSTRPVDPSQFYQDKPILTFSRVKKKKKKREKKRSYKELKCTIPRQNQLSGSLTTLSSERLKAEACDMFKCTLFFNLFFATRNLLISTVCLHLAIQMYCGTVIDQMGVDYHVALAQSIVRKAFSEPELRNELYLQLIKQTTNNPYPNSALSIQCWQLIAIVSGVFVPTRLVLPYFKQHLKKHQRKESSIRVFAQYAQYAHDSTARYGNRRSTPSRFEISSVLMVAWTYSFLHLFKFTCCRSKTR